LFPLTGPNGTGSGEKFTEQAGSTRQVTSCPGAYIPARRSRLLEQCIYELEVATGR
jgi:hypothetical protein